MEADSRNRSAIQEREICWKDWSFLHAVSFLRRGTLLGAIARKPNRHVYRKTKTNLTSLSPLCHKEWNNWLRFYTRINNDVSEKSERKRIFEQEVEKLGKNARRKSRNRDPKSNSWDVGTGSSDVNLMQFTYFYLSRVGINSPAVASRDEFTSEIRYPRRKSDGLVSRNLLLPNTQPRRRDATSRPSLAIRWT